MTKLRNCFEKYWALVVFIYLILSLIMIDYKNHLLLEQKMCSKNNNFVVALENRHPNVLKTPNTEKETQENLGTGFLLFMFSTFGSFPEQTSLWVFQA